MTDTYGELDFDIGDRVELHPDAGMSGDRYGVVQALVPYTDWLTLVRVKLDRSGRTIKITPTLIRPV